MGPACPAREALCARDGAARRREGLRKRARPDSNGGMGSPVERIREYHSELEAIRHDLHAHPELGFEETRTSALVADKLASWGIEVHRGLAKTGVVGVVKGRGTSGGRAIGLRADMDCLPVHETGSVSYRSRHDGRMHACGHDGHTTMLLGAARYLAQTRNFGGTAYLIFQPAEESGGGGQVMVKEGLFERFPANEIYALHNWPGLPPGKLAVRAGPVMAATDEIQITVRGRGGHAAMPHLVVDPVVAASHIIAARVGERIFGKANVVTDADPTMGGEDFAYMLLERPGAYAWLGQGGGPGGCFLHNPNYDFNDEVIPLGAGYLAALVEESLPLE